MKLCSGYTFKYEEMKKRGIRLGIGTDGCSFVEQPRYGHSDEARFAPRQGLAV